MIYFMIFVFDEIGSFDCFFIILLENGCFLLLLLFMYSRLMLFDTVLELLKIPTLLLSTTIAISLLIRLLELKEFRYIGLVFDKVCFCCYLAYLISFFESIEVFDDDMEE